MSDDSKISGFTPKVIDGGKIGTDEGKENVGDKDLGVIEDDIQGALESTQDELLVVLQGDLSELATEYEANLKEVNRKYFDGLEIRLGEIKKKLEGTFKGFRNQVNTSHILKYFDDTYESTSWRQEIKGEIDEKQAELLSEMNDDLLQWKERYSNEEIDVEYFESDEYYVLISWIEEQVNDFKDYIDAEIIDLKENYEEEDEEGEYPGSPFLGGVPLNTPVLKLTGEPKKKNIFQRLWGLRKRR